MTSVSVSSSVPVANPEYSRLKAVADELLGRKAWSVSVLVSLGTALVVEANRVVSLPGYAKKQLVIDVVKGKLNEALEASKTEQGASGSQELQTLLFLADHVLPTVIDTLVAVGRGKIDLKKISLPNSWASCFSCVVETVSDPKKTVDSVLSQAGVSSIVGPSAVQLAVPSVVPSASAVPAVVDETVVNVFSSTEQTRQALRLAQEKGLPKEQPKEQPKVPVESATPVDVKPPSDPVSVPETLQEAAQEPKTLQPNNSDTVASV